ncbi:MAG TPA: TonB-dependent receptor, partial [Blastocatellia bacterium]|nr:TonB-dependent receptor [Blastocatellia bacterium]
MKRITIILLTVIISGLMPLAALAQQATATLTGRVVDPQGAVIPGALVKAVQKNTGAARETKTDNDNGLFTLTNLAPGEYEVMIESPGFKTTNYPSLTLLVGQVVTLDARLEVGALSIDMDDFTRETELINQSTSVVDSVINRRAVENLPLNGRNFLELALLVPGNAPAPNFDPTKTETVLISSAGQIGRGGSVTIDGADNNDDVVGGSLLNVTQEAVQEFQIATNRFSAEQGRSGSSIINIVTKAGSNEFHGSGSFFFRDRGLQGLPATFDRSNPEPPFDREQYAFAVGGPLKKDRVFWFGAFEYRNQDGAVLVGQRDTATRTITRGFAPAPLNDLLGTARGDWNISDTNRLSLRYSVERVDDTTASSLIRAIGSASERQASENHYQSFSTNYERVISPVAVNDFNFSVTNFINRTEPVTPGPQFTFPSL